MNSTFSTDLVARWAKDTKPPQKKPGEQWLEDRSDTAQRRWHHRLTFQLYSTQLWEKPLFGFSYIGSSSVKSHQRQAVQSGFCYWALQSFTCQVLPLLVVRRFGCYSLSLLTVKSTSELDTAGSASRIELFGELRLKCPICTLIFTRVG